MGNEKGNSFLTFTVCHKDRMYGRIFLYEHEWANKKSREEQIQIILFRS
jgi:hypothetical protein